MPTLRSEIASIEPGILISDVITLQKQVASTLLTERLLSGLSSTFGFLATILSAIGLYGVLSYRVGRQRLAIGIRMALGASPASVAMAVVRQSGLVVALGILAGLPFALIAARMAGNLLWGVKADDPLTYTACAVILCLVAAASAYIPARRAAEVEPAETLRNG